MTPSTNSHLQKLAYDALSSYFQQHEEEVVEIEILPPAIEPPDGICMQDGLNLGVPKHILALAFVEARRVFFSSLPDSDNYNKAFHATRVILLFDTEYLTAANFRKRRLIALKHDFTQLKFRRALQQELCFLDSILTSPLHRQSKSPTLWNHRSWLLLQIIPVELENATGQRVAALIKAALVAVFKSAEQHPKNYYAWQYARRLVVGLEAVAEDIDAPFPAEWVISEFCDQVEQWCLKHPGDTSGWSYLLYLLARSEPVSERHYVVERVVQYAIRLQWAQESLWIFVRTALAHRSLLEEREEIIQTLQDVERTEQNAEFSKYVDKTLHWIKTYGP